MGSPTSTAEGMHNRIGTGNWEEENWGNPETLKKHFEDHGKDFDSPNSSDYAQKANDFFNNQNNYQVKVDEKGIIRVYDPKTNTFGSYNPIGTTRTFFKPTGGQKYFDRQPGEIINKEEEK